MTGFTKISEFIGRVIYFLVSLSLLLVAVVLLVVGLGIFHRLNQPAKEQNQAFAINPDGFKPSGKQTEIL